MGVWILERLVQFGVLADEGLSVITGGDADQTLSERAAKAAFAGNRTACIFCHVLGVLIQRKHCWKQLYGLSMRPLNYARGAACIVIVYGLPIWLLTRI